MHTILIVEDEILEQQFLKEIVEEELQGQGQILTCTTGTQAIETARKKKSRYHSDGHLASRTGWHEGSDNHPSVLPFGGGHHPVGLLRFFLRPTGYPSPGAGISAQTDPSFRNTAIHPDDSGCPHGHACRQ